MKYKEWLLTEGSELLPETFYARKLNGQLPQHYPDWIFFAERFSELNVQMPWMIQHLNFHMPLDGIRSANPIL